MTTRRGFLAGILAAASAPALCKAGFLMPVRSIELPLSLEERCVENLRRAAANLGDLMVKTTGGLRTGDVISLSSAIQGRHAYTNMFVVTAVASSGVVMVDTLRAKEQREC